MTNTIMRIEDILSETSLDWEIRYRPDDKSYLLKIENRSKNLFDIVAVDIRINNVLREVNKFDWLIYHSLKHDNYAVGIYSTTLDDLEEDDDC